MLLSKQQVAYLMRHCVSHQTAGREPVVILVVADLRRVDRSVAIFDHGHPKRIAEVARAARMGCQNPNHYRSRFQIGVAQRGSRTLYMSKAMDPLRTNPCA